MFHASLGAFWRSSGTEEPHEAATRVQLAGFFAERARWIPLRLIPSERRVLRLLEGVLQVSHYTDRVDAHGMHEAPAKRRQAQLLVRTLTLALTLPSDGRCSPSS